MPSSHYAIHSAGSLPPVRCISRCQGSHTYLFWGLLRHCSTSPMGLSDTRPLFLLLHVMRSFSCEQVFSQARGGMDTSAQMWQLFFLHPWSIPSPPVGSGVKEAGEVASKEITLWKLSAYFLKSSRGDMTGRWIKSQHKITKSKCNCSLLRQDIAVVDTSLYI